MSTPSISAQTPLVFHPEDDQTYAINATQFGIGTRTIASMGTITVSPSGPTITGAAVIATTTTGEYGQAVAASKAFQFDMSGGTANTEYTFTAPMTLSDGSEMNGVFRGECRSA